MSSLSKWTTGLKFAAAIVEVIAVGILLKQRIEDEIKRYNANSKKDSKENNEDVIIDAEVKEV